MSTSLDGTSVIIPVFNNWRLTQRCLETLFANTDPGLLTDVIVVDNGSNDETPHDLQRFTQVTALRFPENRGFAAASNAGAKIARGRTLLFLNNDAFTPAGSVATLTAALDDPSVGIAGARLLYGDGTLQHAGMAVLSTGDWWHVHVHLDGALPDANVARDYLAVTGAAMMMRAPDFMALGGFDEAYRNGYEDVDLCMKAWRAGMRVRYEPKAWFTHLESATSGRFEGEMHNRARFMERWTPALATQSRLDLQPLPALGFLGDLISGTVAAQAGRHFVRYARGMGLPVRYYVGETPVMPPEVEAWTREAFNPAAFVDWLDVAPVVIEGRKRILMCAPADAAEARAYERATFDTIWTPTFAGRDLLVAAGLAGERIEVVRVGADNGMFTPAAPPFGFNVPQPIILAYAGRMTTDEHLTRLLDVLAGVRAEASLVVLTDLPGERIQPRVVKLAEQIGARVNSNRRIAIISTVGGTEALVPGFFTAARAVLVPAPPEPTGFVLLAAMACAAPIVAADDPALLEFLTPKSAVIAGGLSDMVAAVDRAIDAPEGWRSLRETAQFDAVRQFSVQLSIRRARELLRRLCWGDTDAARLEVTQMQAATLRRAGEGTVATHAAEAGLC